MFDPITFTFCENSNYGRERCKGKMMVDVVSKFEYKKFVVSSNVLLLRLKQTFPPIFWIFTEGDEIESRLCTFKIFSTSYVLTALDDWYFD